MVASVLSPPSPRELQRVHSLGNNEFDGNNNSKSSSNMSSSSGFGSLLRRVGGSQRGGFKSEEPEEEEQPQQQQSMTSSQSRGSLGGLLRRSLSLRGLDRSNSRRKRLGSTDEELTQDTKDEEGPSGVESFLKQIEPSAAEVVVKKKAAPVTKEVEPTTKKSSGGLFRGLMKKAASFRSSKSSSSSSSSSKKLQQQQQQEPDLEPVLVLTDGNHGKVLFQCGSSDALDVSSTPSYIIPEHPLHQSLPDLLSTTSADQSSYRLADVKQQLHNSFHTARTSATSGCSINGGGGSDNEFVLDFSEREICPVKSRKMEELPPVQEEMIKSPTKTTIASRLRTFFRRTKSGRIVENTPAPLPPNVSQQATDGGSTSSSSSSLEEAHFGSPQQQEIALPCLTEEKEEERTAAENKAAYMNGLLSLKEKDDEEEEEKADTKSTASSSDTGSEDLGLDEVVPTNNNNNAGYCQDIQVEAQPPRVYDELEIFYEEATFAHVGGSLLLGSQSELMTVHEYGEEDEDFSDNSEEDGFNPQVSLARYILPVVEEQEEEETDDDDDESLYSV